MRRGAEYSPTALRCNDAQFQDDKFVGWFLGDEAGAEFYSTVSGIGIGTTRQGVLHRPVVDHKDSTLGEEFSTGTGGAAIGGMFAEPGKDAKIEALFAGANCFAGLALDFIHLIGGDGGASLPPCRPFCPAAAPLNTPKAFGSGDYGLSTSPRNPDGLRTDLDPLPAG